ncbi:MAG: hypothetical protein RJA22_1282 [Verrucomicrobiota bacterium]
MKPNLLLLLAGVASLLPTPLPGADAKPKPGTHLTVETAGPDYTLQGEYRIKNGGAHIIALGNDQFRLVSYKGGLPGDGWDQQTRTEYPGRREGDKVVFTGADGYRAELAGGVLSVSTAGGGPWSLTKTHRSSPTLGAKPPAGAVVLFDVGRTADEFAGGHLDERGLLAAGCTSKRKFQSFTLHAEFLLPFKPLGRGQDRGNSGVYLQDRYEVQVLDSFGLRGMDNECGGVYTKARPLVNMCYPPLVWQTYDIDFEAAKFDAAGKKTGNAVVTVKHNGVVIHDKLEINGPTGGGKPEGPTPGGIQLQGHGNPVFYRNVWVVER